MSTERTQEIEDAASGLLIRRDRGAWTDEDRAGFEAWLAASILHRVAFLRLELAWDEVARLKALGAGVLGDQPPPPGEWNLSPFFESRDRKVVLREEGEEGTIGEVMSDSHEEPEEMEQEGAPLNAIALNLGSGSTSGSRPVANPTAGSRRFARISAFSLAASLILVVALGAYRWFEPAGHRYSTPIGGLASVPLPDGSSITLNTATVVRVDLTAKEREVDLTQGEAFFQVAKDATRPFIVNAGRKRVITVGTQFSVRRDGDANIEVVVTEGKVRIEDARGGSFGEAGSSDVFLTPGSIAHASNAGVLVQRRTVPETQEALSWRAGILMFRDERLADAVAEFNRYNARQIVISDPAIAAIKIEGNFRATNVDAFVRLLESGFPVRASATESEIVLRSN